MKHDQTLSSEGPSVAETNGGAEPVTSRITTEPEQQQDDYRDITIEPPKPPFRLKLVPPVEYDGKAYHELIFDFDKMIGKDFQRAERDFTRMYKPDRSENAVLPEMKHLYHCIIAAQVADVPIGLIFKLPRPYYNEVRTLALKACGSSPEEINP